MQIKRQARRGFSLHLKAIAALVVVVVSAATLGGWISSHLLSEWTAQAQADHAARVADILRVSITDRLARADTSTLQLAATEFLHHQDVIAVSIIDADGKVVARARQQGVEASIAVDEANAAELAYTHQVDRTHVRVARPVIAADSDRGVVGAVRIVMDTTAAAARLRRTQITMGLMILAFVMGFVPLGHLLLSRVLIRPIRRLVHATGRLAEGDYSARADHDGRDEIGDLAHSFNTMAEKMASQHRQLIRYNEHLEEQVALRTAELDNVNTRLRSEMDDHQAFLRAVSHDLNAPLRNIGGMTAMLMVKFADELPAAVMARLQRIGANVETQTELIADLLELSRIGTQPSRPEWVDMGEVLIEVSANLEFDLRQRGIALEIASGMPDLFIERNHVRQVFSNLLDNAIKYMGPRSDGRIEISYTCDADGHYFHVADNGIGINAADCERIFVVFRRAADAPAGTTGKGVGLAGVSAIATKYEGQAWVDSEPGRGSVFHVSFARRLCSPPSSDEKIQTHDSAIAQDQTACCPVG